jgi:tRNA pseudouridine55 synthase
MRGVLNINKPSGITSYDVIRRLKPVLGTKKLGHAGTLDPLASGVLLILVNEATKIADYLQIPDKEYVAEIRLGIRTDTDDITGRVLEEKPVAVITREQVLSVLVQFKGEIEQKPPAFSALKVRGERSYRLARRGEAVEHESRKVTVRELELMELRTANCGVRNPEFPTQRHKDTNPVPNPEFSPPRHEDTNPVAGPEAVLRVRAVVSSGTYVRALARDIGEKLGCGATLQSLVRTRVGEFLIEDAIGMEDPDSEFSTPRHKDTNPMSSPESTRPGNKDANLDMRLRLISRLIPVPKALAFLPGATVVADALPRLLSGRTLAQDEVRMANDDCAATALDSPVVIQDEAQRVLFIAQYSDGKLKPKRGIYADI